MRTSETIGQIAKALSAFQGEVTNPPRDGVNPHFKSKFSTLSTVLEHIRPILSKHGLCITHALAPMDNGTYVCHARLIHAESGEFLESEAPILAKSDGPHAFFGGFTYAKRNTTGGLTGTEGDPDDDGNAAQEEPKKKRMSTAPERPAPVSSDPDAEPPTSQDEEQLIQIGFIQAAAEPLSQQLKQQLARKCRDLNMNLRTGEGCSLANLDIISSYVDELRGL